MAGGQHQAPSGQGAPRASAERASGGGHPYQVEADFRDETGAAGSRSRASGASRAGQSTHGSALGTPPFQNNTIRPSLQKAQDHSIAVNNVCDSNSRPSEASLAV